MVATGRLRSRWFSGLFLLFLLPVLLSGQPDNKLAILMKDLQKNTAQDTVRVNALVAIGSYYLQKRGARIPIGLRRMVGSDGIRLDPMGSDRIRRRIHGPGYSRR